MFKDIPTKHTVKRFGRTVRVYNRIYEECMGGGSKLVTHVSEKQQNIIRRKNYNNTHVGILSWTEVQPWEVGL